MLKKFQNVSLYEYFPRTSISVKHIIIDQDVIISPSKNKKYNKAIKGCSLTLKDKVKKEVESVEVKKYKHKNHEDSKCTDKIATEFVNDEFFINHPSGVVDTVCESNLDKSKKLVLEVDDTSKAWANVRIVMSEGSHAYHVIFGYLEEVLINAHKKWKYLSRDKNYNMPIKEKATNNDGDRMLQIK